MTTEIRSTMAASELTCSFCRVEGMIVLDPDSPPGVKCQACDESHTTAEMRREAEAKARHWGELAKKTADAALDASLALIRDPDEARRWDPKGWAIVADLQTADEACYWAARGWAAVAKEWAAVPGFDSRGVSGGLLASDDD